MSRCGKTPGPARHAAYRMIDGRMVVIHTGRNTLLTLNETGTFIWRLLGRSDIDAIARALCEEFEVAPDEARLDVVDFIDEMGVRDLLDTPRETGE